MEVTVRRSARFLAAQVMTAEYSIVTMLRYICCTFCPVPFDVVHVLRWLLAPSFRKRTSQLLFLLRLTRLVLLAPSLRAVLMVIGAPGPSLLSEVVHPFVFQLKFNFHRVHDWLMEMTRKHGRTFRLTPAWCSVVVMTSDPQCVRHILEDKFDIYTKTSWVMSDFRELVGNGLFTADHDLATGDRGTSWRLQRTTSAKIFSTNVFRNFMEKSFTKYGRDLQDILEERACSGEEFDIQELFLKLTLDSTIMMGLGVRVDSMHTNTPLEHALDRAQVLSTARVASLINRAVQWLLPYRWYPGAMRCLKWALASERAIGKAISQLDEFVFEVIRQRRQERERVAGSDSDSDDGYHRSGLSRVGSESSWGWKASAESFTMLGLEEWTDFLSLFMDAETALPTAEAHATIPPALSDRFLRDVMMSFLVAGRDTTSSTLSWMFLLLGQHPVLQEDLLKELDGELKGKTPSFVDLREGALPLLNAVVWETLRLFPPIAGNAKRAARDDRLPDGTFVPAGSEVVYLPFAMGRDPKIWDDADQFKPQRWIPFKQPSPYEMPVFQAGPRTCLGMSMAILQVKLVTTLILQRYRLELSSPSQSWKYQVGTTIRVKDGLRVTARRRGDPTETWYFGSLIGGGSGTPSKQVGQSLGGLAS